MSGGISCIKKEGDTEGLCASIEASIQLDDDSLNNRRVSSISQTDFRDYSNLAQKQCFRREIPTALLVCIGPFALGSTLGFSSPAIPRLEDEGLLNTSQAGWFGSVINLGAILGCLIAGHCVEQFGRKATLLFSGLPYASGWLIIACATEFKLLLLGRLLAGIGGGMTSLTVPVYIAEVTSSDVRGRLGASFQIGTTSGILFVYTLGLFLHWRWLAISCLVPPVLLTCVAWCLPETPRWLLMKRTEYDAIEVLHWLRGPGAPPEDVISECNEINNDVKRDVAKLPWSEFQKPHLYRPLLLSVALMLFQQFSGINAVIFYTESIFTRAGYSGEAGLPAVIAAAVKVTVTCFSTTLMDKVGRRPLFLIGGILMTISCVTFGIYFYSNSHWTIGLSWLGLASLISYVLAFSLGWGSVPILIMSEIFPIEARARASTVATVVNWTSSFVVTVSFLPFVDLIHDYGVFWFFGGVCMTGTITALICLPETKLRTLEGIRELF